MWTEFCHVLTPSFSAWTLSVDQNRRFLTPYPLILSTQLLNGPLYTQYTTTSQDTLDFRIETRKRPKPSLEGGMNKKKKCINKKESGLLELGVRGEGHHGPSQIFADQLALFKPVAGRLCPSHPPPQIFKPSYGPESRRTQCKEFLTKRKNERKGEKACRKNWK